MIKGRQNDSVSLALELRHSGSGYCFFAWLMFLPGSLHTMPVCQAENAMGWMLAT